MYPGAGRTGDRLVLVFRNIWIVIQLMLDVEAGRRAPENEMAHLSEFDEPATPDHDLAQVAAADERRAAKPRTTRHRRRAPRDGLERAKGCQPAPQHCPASEVPMAGHPQPIRPSRRGECAKKEKDPARLAHAGPVYGGNQTILG